MGAGGDRSLRGQLQGQESEEVDQEEVHDDEEGDDIVDEKENDGEISLELELEKSQEEEAPKAVKDASTSKSFKSTEGRSRWESCVDQMSKKYIIQPKTRQDYVDYLVRFETYARQEHRVQIKSTVPPCWDLICAWLVTLSLNSAAGARAALRYVYRKGLEDIKDSDWQRQKGQGGKGEIKKGRKIKPGPTENAAVLEWIGKLKEQPTGKRKGEFYDAVALKWSLLYQGALRKQDLLSIPFNNSTLIGDYVKTAEWT